MVNPQVSGLIQQLFEPHERGRPFGLLGATIGVSTAVGPLLGGLLIQVFGAEQGWRWIFYINVPIGLAAIVLGHRWIPARPREQREHESLDPVGVGLLGVGVFLLLLPLVQEREWTGNGKWLLVVAAAVVLAGFWVWERRFGRHSTSVVDLGLFRVRSYALGALVGVLYFGGFTSIFFTYTLFLQNGLHYSALQAGLAITPFALGSAVTAAIGGRKVDRTGRTLVVAGLVIVALGLAGTVAVLHFVTGTAAGWATVVPLLVTGLGSGLVISPNQTLTLSEVPVERAGSAAAVLQTGQRIGTAIGIAGVGAVFFNRLAHHDGDWGLAFRTSLSVTIAFVVAALIAATADVLAGRRSEHQPAPR